MALRRPSSLLLVAAVLCVAARAALAQQAKDAEQKIFNQAVFPTSAERPPLWKFRSLKDVKSVSCSVNKVGVLLLVSKRGTGPTHCRLPVVRVRWGTRHHPRTTPLSSPPKKSIDHLPLKNVTAGAPPQAGFVL